MSSISQIKIPNNPLVSVIIINFNGKKYIEKCLNSLMCSTYKNLEILFVDNASIDGSAAYVGKHFPTVKTIVLDSNYGYSGAHDIAFYKCHGEAILFLNIDTVIGKNTVRQLVDFLYKVPKIGCAQPLVVLSSDSHKIDSVGAFFVNNGNLYHAGREKNKNEKRFQKPFPVFTVKNVATLVKREVIEKTGLFDPDYFAYFEETDFCMRVWLSGYTVWYCPTEPVVHYGGGGAGQFPNSHILFHSEKNRICTYIKNFSAEQLLKTMPKLLLMYQLVILLYILLFRVKEALSIYKAIIWNIVHVRNTIKKRTYVQNSIRRISDAAYLPALTKSVNLSYYYFQFFGGLDRYEE